MFSGFKRFLGVNFSLDSKGSFYMLVSQEN